MSADLVVVVGGGISGLATAWFLHQRGVAVRVLESRKQPGGVILTSHLQGCRIEHGPNSTLQKPHHPDDALGRLVRDVGLDDRLLVANKAAARRYVLRGGKPVSLPDSPWAFLTTPLFSGGAKWRLLREPFVARAVAEESIAEFVRRRLGPEFLDYAVEPFVSGVYAGDPKTLSVQAAVARIYALERDHGSLIRGALAQGRVGRGSGMPKGRMVSFDTGMGALPEAINRRLPPGTVQTGLLATHLEKSDRGWLVRWKAGSGQGGTELARDIVLAVPAPMAAALTAPFSKSAARLLEAVEYPPLATVALAYKRSQVGHPLDGFGLLVPRREGVRLLGVLFSSTLFPGRTQGNRVLLTAFIGGAQDPAVLHQADQELIAQVERDLARCLAISGPADFVHLTRYAAAIPQYTVGHLQRMAQLDAALAAFPGIHLRANWRDGVSVADCIRNGEKLAEKIARSRGASP